MDCVRIAKNYENHLTYPMVVNHRIMEVEGRIINSWANDSPMVISYGQWNELMSRLDYLEKAVGQQTAHNPLTK